MGRAEADAEIPIKQELVEAWIQWWDAVWVHWCKQPDFEQNYLSEYLSVFLKKLPIELHPQNWLAPHNALLTPVEGGLIPGVVEHREPGQGRVSWWLGLAMGQQILDPQVPVLKKDAAWVLVNEWGVASEACMVHIGRRPLYKPEKLTILDFAKFSGNHLDRYAFSMDRERVRESVSSWNNGQITPFETALAHVNLNADRAVRWIAALLNHETTLFVECASILDYPPILSPILSLDRCIGRVEIASDILTHAPLVAGQWPKHSLGALLLEAALEETYALQQCIYGQDFYRISNDLQDNTITAWKKWISIIAKRADEELLSSVLVQRLMDDIELQIAQPVGKCHVALQLLALLDAARIEKTVFPVPLLESFHRGRYRQALWHCYLRQTGLEFSDADKQAVRYVIENISGIPCEMSWGDVFAAEVFLKTDDLQQSWLGIWREYELERERLWWTKSGVQDSASLGCLWLGVMALCCVAPPENGEGGNEQQAFALLLWPKIWELHLSGIDFLGNSERLISFFLTNQLQRTPDVPIDPSSPFAHFLRDIGLEKDIWKALLSRVLTRSSGLQGLMQHIRAVKPELLKRMGSWAELEKSERKERVFMSQPVNVFQNFLNET